MSVVSNASPLISLAKLGRLPLLYDLFGDIHITPEVFHEVVVAGAGRPAATAVQSVPWIRVQPCQDTALLHRWQQQYRLGAGELATILLAQEIAASLAVIDERSARHLARSRGVNVIGCISVLEIACRRGLISDLRTIFQEMLAHGVRVDRNILNRSLTSFSLPPL